MKFKKYISFILCISMMFSLAVIPTYASNGTQVSTPAIINTAEEIRGIVVNCFAKLINKIKGTDENAISSATVNPHSWIEYNCEPIRNPEQTLNAETWVANEISFESEKSYANPFNDVDIEFHLWGNGRLYKIPAFWDGGDIWRARFTCTEEGTWTYKTVCSDEENSGLHSFELQTPLKI